MIEKDYKRTSSKGNPYDIYTEEQKERIEKMLKEIFTPNNSDYAKSKKCEYCKNLKGCNIEEKASCSDFMQL